MDRQITRLFIIFFSTAILGIFLAIILFLVSLLIHVNLEAAIKCELLGTVSAMACILLVAMIKILKDDL